MWCGVHGRGESRIRGVVVGEQQKNCSQLPRNNTVRKQGKTWLYKRSKSNIRYTQPKSDCLWAFCALRDAAVLAANQQI